MEERFEVLALEAHAVAGKKKKNTGAGSDGEGAGGGKGLTGRAKDVFEGFLSAKCGTEVVLSETRWLKAGKV